jgi:hypothetical protein
MLLLLKCINHLGKINYYLSHSKFGKHNIFSKFRISVGKFQIEEGPHTKIQREGRVCINNID